MSESDEGLVATDAKATWSPGLVVLHWTMAVLIAAQFLLANRMQDETRDLIGRLELYQWHKSVGLSLAALLVARLALRALGPAPADPTGAPTWQRWIAGGTHGLLYLCLIALPLSGFLMVSSAPIQIPTLLFGILPVPHPIGPDKATYELMQRVHALAGDGLLWLAALHVAGAVFHPFAWGDNVLSRMWLRSSRG
jgi:cytochrome b561